MTDRGRFAIVRGVIEAGWVLTAARALPTGWAIAQADFPFDHERDAEPL